MAVAVVVPYFQREPGILCRSLQSVFDQKAAPPVQLFIVDDGSPLPAIDELARLESIYQRQITLLQQKNGGPGSARNAALSAIPASFLWIAFLDSDDIWHESHLFRAVRALEKGYDFFFANYERQGSSVTAFDESGFDQANSRPIDVENRLFEYNGNLFRSILRHTPVGTPTVVFRNDVVGGLRFTESIHTCEDLLFWLEVAKSPARVAFGRDVQVTKGKGVNIFDSIIWNSNESLRQHVDYSIYFSEVRRRFALVEEERQVLAGQIRKNREEFVQCLASMVLRGRNVDVRALGKFIKKNPTVFVDFIRIIGSRLVSG
jgi:succinoglycan biosynthesis protein ExoW